MSTKAKLFIKFAIKHVECGSHSGFKPCCIFWYAVLDNISSLHKCRFYNGRRYFNRIVQRLRHKKFGYVPCPYCLFGQPVDVKHCEWDSGHEWDMGTIEDMDLYDSIAKSGNSLVKNLSSIEKFMNFVLQENCQEYRYG